MHKRSSILSWRPRTTVILTVGFSVVLVALAVAYVLDHFKPTTQLYIGSSGVYAVQVADTERARVKGLSGVKKLSPNGGLLMVFQEDGAHKIWMKDMHIPIDVVWLDKNKKVVHMEPTLTPDTGTSKQFGPKEPTVRYIVELPEGAIKNSAIRKGGSAQFEIEGVKK